MALVLEIVLGLMILASFFVAYMSAKTWQIYQAVLVAFIFLGSVAFFYLAARTLATHNAWRTLVNRTKTELETIQKQTQQTVEGGPANAEGQREPKGIRQLQQDMQRYAVDRDGVIYDVTVDEAKDGVLQLTLKSADHGLAANSVVFLFDDAALAEGGGYRGEYKVVAIGDDATKVQIAPNLPLSPAQTARAGAVGPVTLYTTMPIDDAGLFAALDEPTREGLVPAASRAEYANAERKLRDYELFFHQHFLDRSLLTDAINKLSNNIDRMTAAAAEADKEAGYRTTEKTNLTADLQGFQRDTKAIADYHAALENVYRQVRESLKATFLANRQMVGALTADQFRAAEEIDRRSDAAQDAAPSSAVAP